jgi:hypothetical protein
LLAVEMKPRTLCACQSQADIISAKVAPLARPIISRIFAPLPWRFGAFLLFAGFFSLAAPALGLAALPFFRLLGAPFFRLVAFVGVVFSGATGAPC